MKEEEDDDDPDKTHKSGPISMKDQFRQWRKRNDCCHFLVCSAIYDYQETPHSSCFRFEFEHS